MNVANRVGAVDCARLIYLITNQIQDCLAGKQNEVYITTNPALLPTAITRYALAEAIQQEMLVEFASMPAELFAALDDDLQRSKLKVARNQVILQFAEYTAQRMTEAEKESLLCVM